MAIKWAHVIVHFEMPRDATMYQALNYVSEAVAKHRKGLKSYVKPLHFVDRENNGRSRAAGSKITVDTPAEGDPMWELNPHSVTVEEARPQGKASTIVPPSESDIAADVASRKR